LDFLQQRSQRGNFNGLLNVHFDPKITVLRFLLLKTQDQDRVGPSQYLDFSNETPLFCLIFCSLLISPLSQAVQKPLWQGAKKVQGRCVFTIREGLDFLQQRS
jgi:hypothetical protein